ncbi:TonB-dependent receptor [Gammaproteobacteria bacterium]|jgi:Fe(3+) dicitrate transport protein|nr:TonB-dependent receptor [Gammaproteobacteria bacterium]
MKHSKLLLTLAISAVSASLANAQEVDGTIEEVTIVGSREQAQRIAGSAHYIGSDKLAQFAYSDIQRIAREVPGVAIQIEDGYGLRPNIGIRGVATERSGRITLLEDNVLIAPAPYSAPSAYYFPTVGRLSAIEVVKGPAAITQGPYTIGGALNMVSTPIPTEMSGNIVTEAGENSTYRVHATYGGRSESGLGFLLETHQWQSDGFQDIDRSDNNTGLDVEDYTVKLSYAPSDSAHAIELKLQSTEQNSNQSYLGLTDRDFDNNAFRRYGISALDNIKTEHEQQILRYSYDISDSLDVSVTAYNNEHQRDWFKTEGIDIDGSSSAEDFDRASWANVLQAINSGTNLSGLNPDQLQSILNGSSDTAPGSIQLRSNKREYFSRGLQVGLNFSGMIGSSLHDLEFGIRLHEDEEDRLQRNSNYSQNNGELTLDDLGILGNAGNRVQQAQALAIHIHDNIQLGDWTLSPGLRYEDIEQKRTRFADGELRTFRDSRQNDTQVFLPGLGILYQVNDSLSLLGGAHKGFTAPSNSPNVDEETAFNYELGFRYQNGSLSTELIGFMSDYDNILGECTSSSGSDCTIGDAFNGDAATVAGLELLVSANLARSSSYRIPVSLSYTLIDGEFDTDIADTDFFGSVSKGDPLPYLPENQFLASVGFEKNNWAAYLSGNYVDEVCVRASCGDFEKTDNTFTVDVSANYQFSSALNFYARVENLTSEEDILGRQPYGARPNKDRTVTAGLRFNF